MIEELCDFTSGSSYLYVSTLPSLVIWGIVVVDMFLICHVILQDHVIKYQIWCPQRLW